MVDLNIELPERFLDEEVRHGYIVTKQMKEVWAVELDLLNELKKICEKYNLTYFVDSGTLIGAVRENGIIPWDDDIDVVMFREDYSKLIQVASKELTYPYFLQNAYSETAPYVRAHSQLRNSDTTGCIEGDMDKNINRGIFIDIFPLDSLPDNKLVYTIYKNIIRIFWKLICNADYNCLSSHTLKGKIFHRFANLIVNKNNFKKRFKQYENYCSKYNSRQCKSVSYIAYSRGKEKHIWEKKWFSEIMLKKFEFTEVAIPVGYDARLKKEYGNYMVPAKATTMHGEVLFNTNRSYKEALKDGKI